MRWRAGRGSTCRTNIPRWFTPACQVKSAVWAEARTRAQARAAAWTDRRLILLLGWCNAEWVPAPGAETCLGIVFRTTVWASLCAHSLPPRYIVTSAYPDNFGIILPQTSFMSQKMPCEINASANLRSENQPYLNADRGNSTSEMWCGANSPE